MPTLKMSIKIFLTTGSLNALVYEMYMDSSASSLLEYTCEAIVQLADPSLFMFSLLYRYLKLHIGFSL